jgi:hypothetical protein
MNAATLTPEQRALATLALLMATEAHLIGAYRALFDALQLADAAAVALAHQIIDSAHARHVASIDAANELLQRAAGPLLSPTPRGLQ